MRKWIREWLGLSQIEYQNQKLLEKVGNLQHEIQSMSMDITRASSDISTLFDETDPRRQAASKRLGEQYIKRLEAEDKARRHTLGER